MTRNLVRGLRHAPLFPLIENGDALLSPTYVGDVAAAVSAVLCAPSVAHDSLNGQIIDVCGEETLPLREMVAHAAAQFTLPTLLLPTPMFVHRLMAALFVRLFDDPITVPSQLIHLSEGISGDCARLNSACCPKPIFSLSPPPSACDHCLKMARSNGLASFSVAFSFLFYYFIYFCFFSLILLTLPSGQPRAVGCLACLRQHRVDRRSTHRDAQGTGRDGRGRQGSDARAREART